MATEEHAPVLEDELRSQLLLARARCRVGDNKSALRISQKMHRKFPTSIECLKILVHVCSEMKMKDHVHDYVFNLRQLGVGSPSKFINVPPAVNFDQVKTKHDQRKVREASRSPPKMFGRSPDAQEQPTMVGRQSSGIADRQYLSHDSDMPPGPEDLLGMGHQTLDGLGSEVFEKALSFFQETAALEPNEPKWQLMIANCYWHALDTDQAVQTLIEVIDKNPTNTECLEALVRLSQETNNAENLKEYSERLGAIKKEEEREERLQAEIAERERLVQLHLSKKSNGALDTAKQEGGEDNGDDSSTESGGLSPKPEKEGSQLYRKSMDYFKTASLLQPEQIKWRLTMAQCHRRLGDNEEALRDYIIIHAEFPENIPCIEELVKTLCDIKQEEEGYKYFMKLRAIYDEEPLNTECLRALASVSISLGLRDDFDRYCEILRHTVEEMARHKHESRLETVFTEHKSKIPQARKERLKDVFDHLDQDGTASIEFAELVKLARRFQPGLARAKIKKAMKQLDTQNNGCIDYTDFLNWMSSVCENFSDEEFEAAISSIYLAIVD